MRRDTQAERGGFFLKPLPGSAYLFARQKWMLLLLLLGGVCLLGGCALLDAVGLTPRATETPMAAQAPEGEETRLPEILPQAVLASRDERTVSLYYRMRGENMLARETRTIFVPKDKPFEQVLVEALIDGPGASSLELMGAFISGTRVVNVTSDGEMLSITLSRAFLGTPVDAPMDWSGDPAWRAEVLLRRRLALAAVVNTITEETEYDAVLLLVQRTADDTQGERIARSHLYENAPADALLAPVMRSEQVLLTHHNTAAILFDSWMAKDFTRLQRFVAGRPTEAEFQQEMFASTRSLTGYSLSAGMVSNDGQSAVIVVQMDYTDAAGMARVENYPLRLVRDRGLWKITYEALLRMMEAT